MSKSPAGGPLEKIQKRFAKDEAVQPLLKALEELDTYYRQRLDQHAVKIQQLEDRNG